MKAIEVIIREPRLRFVDIATRFLSGMAATFLIAWFVTLLTPVALGFETDYWQAFWFLILIRLVWPFRTLPYLRREEKQKTANTKESK